MSITVSTKTYSAARTQPDAVLYTGPANTLSIQDTIELKRVYPKPVLNNAGVARPAIKLVRSVLMPDGLTRKDMIMTLSGSIPVGTSDADIASGVADVGSLVALEVAGTTKVMKTLGISY